MLSKKITTRESGLIIQALDRFFADIYLKIIDDVLSLPWSIELIKKYKDKWDWYRLSGNKYLVWSVELVDKYKEKWDWEKLSKNPQLSWSIELTEKYKEKWDWEKLQRNSGIYEKVFQPLLNDEFIDKIMAEIINIDPKK